MRERALDIESSVCSAEGISLLERVTPLARRVNCLDIERIADVCINEIPNLVGVRLASLYVIDETNNILHLQKTRIASR
ncbi:MAG: hypothetical protein ACYST6_15135 [Planctomycetota bacterium]|jgi:hypothetical protein